jgi:hypothetical protein
MIYDKNKNSLEWHSLEKIFLGVAFLGKNFPCCGIPWKKNSLECRTALRVIFLRNNFFWKKII